jgi:hypothetical protein
MLQLEINAKAIYYLENPDTGTRKLATGLQLKYEDIIKDVFGVADIKDLLMMLKFNKGFQDSICKAHGVVEKEIKLEMILRVASKEDLLQHKDHVSNN